MQPVVLFYSYSGNNRLLATTLAEALDCPIVEVEEPTPRKGLRILIDIMTGRFSRIKPVELPPGHGLVLAIAPLWNRKIANPMCSALRDLGAGIGPYCFISLSGVERKGQVALVDKQLVALTGAAPVRHWSLYLDRVIDPALRGNQKLPATRVLPEELAAHGGLGEIVDWVRARQ
jgi:hypothetical protein